MSLRGAQAPQFFRYRLTRRRPRPTNPGSRCKRQNEVATPAGSLGDTDEAGVKSRQGLRVQQGREARQVDLVSECEAGQSTGTSVWHVGSWIKGEMAIQSSNLWVLNLGSRDAVARSRLAISAGCQSTGLRTHITSRSAVELWHIGGVDCRKERVGVKSKVAKH